MDTYCDFTELPTLSCSHCSGKSLDVVEERWERKDYVTSKAESLRDPHPMDEAAPEPSGIYNKTREVYGGNDDHVDFERLTEETT